MTRRMTFRIAVDVETSVPVVWSAVLALAAPRQVPVALLLERRVAKIQIDAVADGPGMGRAYVH